MATVLYVPKDTRWEDAAKGLQQGVEAYMKRQQEEEEMKKFQAVLQAVNSSPDQDTAMRVLTGGATALKKPEHISTAFRLMSEKFPPSDNSLVQSKVYSTINGEEQPFWFERKDAGKLKDPKFVGDITGLQPGSFSMAKPKTFEYVDPETGTSFGIFTPEHRPPGAVTGPDFQRDLRLKAEEKAQQVQKRADEQFLALQEERKIDNKRADARFEETQRENRRQASKTDSALIGNRELTRISREVKNLEIFLARKYGGKVTDGIVDMSSFDEPKLQKFLTEFSAGSQLLEEGKVKVYSQASRQTAKDLPKLMKDAAPVEAATTPAYKEYQEAFRKAATKPDGTPRDPKEVTELRKKITARARELGVVK